MMGERRPITAEEMTRMMMKKRFGAVDRLITLTPNLEPKMLTDSVYNLMEFYAI